MAGPRGTLSGLDRTSSLEWRLRVGRDRVCVWRIVVRIQELYLLEIIHLLACNDDRVRVLELVRD